MWNAGIASLLPLIYIVYIPRIFLATFESYTKYAGRSLSSISLSLFYYSSAAGKALYSFISSSAISAAALN
jgi:hypothetical protein